ncbi:nucleotidyl transferase AbiEii/AbiGii toxin family protein [Formosa haliotis]|uniref:nucleotidyl transferase AbiEii/AbiGii toxin family protein n=1 Tax=Formosa haliotis TaxID=1555194 RepID=UPI0008243C47|nr:nucleotidyl transferase AbiEii/AbiGii toxin family protein [Formosa haliotis]
MKLHQNKKLFDQSIRATAQRMGIADIYVEKDYWVTLTLYQIFKQPIGAETVFKGGTALSKCFDIIQRFSEDVDLVMVRKETDTTSKMERKVKKPSKVIESILPEIYMEGLTNKKGMLRKTVHQYPKVFKGKLGQVRDVIVLEASYLGRFEPYHTQYINSYIGEMMVAVNQNDLAQAYDLMPFQVNVMDVTRTFCEKIMSLVRFSYGLNAIQQLKDKIRHAYDIHQLMNLETVQVFFKSEAFIEMLTQVKEDDRLSFKSENTWLDYPIFKALIFSDTEQVWSQLKTSYSHEFRMLVYGDLPEEKEVLQSLLTIAHRLKEIKL